MSNTLIEYVRDDKNTPTAVFVADQVEDNVRIGFAACHAPLDMFSKKRGKDIALGRAAKFESDLHVEVPERIVGRFATFLERCRTRPSFEGKNFPRWFDNDDSERPKEHGITIKHMIRRNS